MSDIVDVTVSNGGTAVTGKGYGDDGSGDFDHSAASGSSTGVTGASDVGIGVQGNSQNGTGVDGYSLQLNGVAGYSPNGTGVRGIGGGGDGVYGESAASQHAGVSGVNDKGGFGVWGRGTPGGHFESASGIGVNGESTQADGVFGTAHAAGRSGIVGIHSANGNGVYGRAGANGYAGWFDGNVNVSGNITTHDVVLAGGDCAEEFDISRAEKIAPGTVMVIDREGALRQSEKAYDKRVAGVISGAGDYKPGILLDKQPSSEHRMPVALVGKVYCKVDAQYASIEVGDLLTTSPTPGHAMRADDPFKAFGSVIGKALRPLQAGQGLIPILIALQ